MQQQGFCVDFTYILAPVQGEMQDFETSFENILRSDIILADQVVRYIAGRKGKRLRPLLVFLSARLHGTPTLKTISAAMIVELLHTATLIHDDVVDESILRRGSPTVNHLWNNKISVLIGDFLFSRTLTTLIALEDRNALPIISETACRITEGELMQLEHDHDYDMNEAIYFDLVSKKTAALFSASCALGASSVTNDSDSFAKMRLFGENLGVAFQIQDDVLDYIGDVSKLGKPIGSDVRENKITLPLIHALDNAEKSEREKILNLLKDEIDSEKVKQVVAFVNDYGGVEYSTHTAQEYGNKACDILNTYSNSEIKTRLKKLVEFAIHRES
jgi:octaprenyl-diphosphate synthase